jgi:hypothetical protein|nr:MAG TPA: hypothetical protein [Caudoviricetes sp.]
MRWSEFVSLLTGISPDTALGRIVSIRAETDKEILKNFNDEQRKIRNEWLSKHSRATVKKEDAEKSMQNIEKMFMRMAGLNV